MVRMLPFILIAVAVLGGLGYWRYAATRPALTSPKPQQEAVNTADQAPIEVPKTAPGASPDERIKALEDLTAKIAGEINQLKAANTEAGSAASAGNRLDALEAEVTALKVQVAGLSPSSASTTTGSSGKSTIYIPLGSGGQVSDTNWVSLSTFQISLDPSQYPGYKNMQLEVTMRLNQPGGTLSARLYNSSTSSVISGSATTTSTTDQISSTTGFTLSAGSGTYVLQANTSDGSPGFLDYARIRVNF